MQKPSVGQELPILLLALSASATSADTSQELNPRPQLRKASVYHSATSAVVSADGKVGYRGRLEPPCLGTGLVDARQQDGGSLKKTLLVLDLLLET